MPKTNLKPKSQPASKRHSARRDKMHPKYWLSGADAKRFRRGLSQRQGRAGDIVLTHKFPLVAQPLSDKQREQLREEYRLSSAVEPNTLFHFFAAIHLSGFRLFPNVSAAEIYQNTIPLRNSQLNQQLIDCLGMGDDAAIDLYQILSPAIRDKNKNYDAILTKFQKQFKITADEESPLALFLQALAREIANNELWSLTQKKQRYKAIVTAGERLNYKFTLPIVLDYNYLLLWDGSTSTFLQSADFSAEALDFALHQMVSLAACVARTEKGDNIKEADIKAVLLSDTDNYNGLDWLFNKGIALLAKSRAEIEQAGLLIAGCPDHVLSAIRSIAQALEQRRAICSYKKHRSLFGGNIASGVSNYWKRLKELNDGINNIGDDAVPDIKSALQQLGEKYKIVIAEYEQIAVPMDNLQQLITDLFSGKGSAIAALNALRGQGSAVAGATEVERVEQFNDSFEEAKGLFIQLAEKLRAHHNNDLPTKQQHKKGDFKVAREALPQLEFLLPRRASGDDEGEDTGKYLKRKINRFQGSQVFSLSQIQTQLLAEQQKLSALQSARREHWQSIVAKYPVDIIAVREQIEQKFLDDPKVKNATTSNKTEMACRNLLQRLANTVKNLGEHDARAAGVRQFESAGVFAAPAEGARYFYEGKGRLYVSVYANYRSEPLALGESFKHDIRQATDKFIKHFFSWAQTMRAQASNAMQLRDGALLEQTFYALSCSGISGNIATADARPKEALLSNPLPVSLQLALAKAEINSGQLARLFNAYASEINGLCARLGREIVINKLRLQHINDKDLYYQPKPHKNWQITAHLLDDKKQVVGESALARGWRLLQNAPDEMALFTDETKTAIHGNKLPQAISYLYQQFFPKQGERDEMSFKKVLRQIPHDYLYKNSEYTVLSPCSEQKFPRLVDSKNQLVGLWQLEKKDKVLILKPVTGQRALSENYLRLSGTSAHKGWLDEALQGDTSFGDSSLIIEEEYTQQYQDNQLTINYANTRVEIAAVFNSPQQKVTQPFPLANKMLAIDLGERGIGYAVFNVPQNGDELPMPIKQGHVIIPLLRKLIRKVDVYRRQKQPRQRFQSNLNTALQSMREATIGEVTGVIDALIKKHSAFPIFESTVGGFESGGKMLKMVYGSILQRYTFSEVDAHKTKRQNHWQAAGGAPQWQHPFLINKSKIPTKPLSLFPGVMVGPAGTSQMCSHCKVNPLTLIDNMDKGDFPIKSDERGVITVDGHEMYIFGGRVAGKKTDNPLPCITKVIKNKQFSNKDVLRGHIKKYYRHHPASSKSRDTSQSSYLSPFVSVQQALINLPDDELKRQSRFKRNGLVYMHADINAAINIGRKWWVKINTPPAEKKVKQKKKK